MTDRKPTFAEACRDLRNAVQAVINIYARTLQAMLPALPILLRLTARVVFYVPGSRRGKIIYTVIATGMAALGVTISIVSLLR